jgi:hypothetical protein
MREIELQIRHKILEKCGRDNQEARNAYALFGRPANGVSFETFCEWLACLLDVHCFRFFVDSLRPFLLTSTYAPKVWLDPP